MLTKAEFDAVHAAEIAETRNPMHRVYFQLVGGAVIHGHVGETTETLVRLGEANVGEGSAAVILSHVVAFWFEEVQ